MDRLTISEVARQLGCSASTLEKYERRGILPKAQRSRGGWRIYTADDAERIRRILFPPNGNEAA